MAIALLVASGLAASAAAQVEPGREDASNMRLVGFHDLEGRSAYQPVVTRQADRWIAYIGHHGGSALNPLSGHREDNGTSIVDVTDPASPRYLAHIPGEPGEGETGGAQMVRICAGAELPKGNPGKYFLLRTYGNSAHQLWDVSAPDKPTLLSTVESHLRDTHKNWWECDSGIAYLVSGVPGWKPRRMMQVFDLSDPAHPRFIRNFGLPGQQPSAPDSKEAAAIELHGATRVGNRLYLGYNVVDNGVVQILDRDKLLHGDPSAKDPLEPTDSNLLYPQVVRLNAAPPVGAHTAFPVLGMDIAEFARNTEGRQRDILVVVGESLRNECRGENRQMAYFVDITRETRPWPVSNFQVPEEEGHFCDRGGRFGTHSSNESMTPVFYRRLVFLAYFNAGVRAVDIRNPWSPREVGHYIPAVTANTEKRCIKVDGADRCKTAIQTNNVEVDDRGYIYAVDRAGTGLHILELTGPARAVARLP